MNVLILGARGMLGGYLAQAFTTTQPVLWDKEELDITDASAVAKALRDLSPTLIINAAAYTAVDKAESERELCFAVNADGVRTIAQAAQKIGATMVHYSTDYVFSGTKQDGYTEDDAPGSPVNMYGASKLQGEEYLRAAGCPSYLIRTSWLYGHGGKNFVDTMLAIGRQKPEVRVVSDQWGSPTYAHDVAQATHTLIAENYPLSTYHLVNDGVATWADFAQTVLTAAGLATKVVPIASRDYPLPAQRPQYSILVNSKGPRLRAWQEAVDEYVKAK